MSSRVRLLPALIGAAGVLMLLRIGAMASSTDETPAPEVETAATESANAPTVEGPVTPTADAPAATTESAPLALASEPKSASVQQAQTKGEAEILQNLSERRSALEARERDVAMREQLMGATEKRVEERLVELKGLEEKLNTMLAKRDEEEEAQITSLVKTYENIKPTDAAKIFNKLDRTIMLTVASRMKPAKIGAVMAAMEPQRAQELTVLLATRMKVARTQPTAPPGPAPVAAPQAAAAEATAPASPVAQPGAAAAPPQT